MAQYSVIEAGFLLLDTDGGVPWLILFYSVGNSFILDPLCKGITPSVVLRHFIARTCVPWLCLACFVEQAIHGSTDLWKARNA